MNPVTNTPDAVLAETAEPVDALDALLRQIVNGYFVLTDGQGAVSKWSEPAELLFEQPSEDILGQGFFESLIGDTLPPEGHAWRGFLATGEPPQAPGTVQLTGRRSDGDVFPLEAVFVPVKLDEGFDFSLFLEDLSFELPMNLMLLRMRQQHPVVVRALQAGARARGAAVGGLAHRRHAGRLPPAVRDPVGRGRAGPPRGRARRRRRRGRGAPDQHRPGHPGRRQRPRRRRRGRRAPAAARWSASTSSSASPAACPRSSRRRAARPTSSPPPLRSDVAARAVRGPERARPPRAAGRAREGRGRRRAPERPPRPARARPRPGRDARRRPDRRGRRRRRGARRRGDRRVRPPRRRRPRRARGAPGRRRRLRPARAGPRRARGGRAGRPRRARDHDRAPGARPRA